MTNESDQILAAGRAGGRRLDEFRYDKMQDAFWDLRSRVLLKDRAVDASVHPFEWPVDDDGDVIRPSAYIRNFANGQVVDGAVWWPGKPKIIEGHYITPDGLLVQDPNSRLFNRYIPAVELPVRRDVSPQPMIDHVRRLYPDDADKIFDDMAFGVQNPTVKINRGLLLAGPQGIGKDTMLLPLRKAYGAHNVAEIGPDDIMTGYSSYVQNLLIVINEVRSHDHFFKASNFYNIMKPLLAAPPEMLPRREKYEKTTYAVNVCRVIITTNEPLGTFIPEGDRRISVANTTVTAEELGGTAYFQKLHAWLRDGGAEAFIEWLRERDVSHVDPAAPAWESEGKAQIIEAAQVVRRSLFDEVLESYIDELGERPTVIFPADLIAHIGRSQLFDDMERAVNAVKARDVPHKMEGHRYVIVRPPAREGRWKAGNFRSRSAYVDAAVPAAKRRLAVEAELRRRTEGEND